MKKADLIQAIYDGRSKIEGLWAGATEAQLTQRPGPQADWSVKDLIAHLTYWEQKIVNAVQESLRGETPVWEDVDVVNARVFAANRDRSLDEIERDFRQSLEQIVAQIQALSEEDLANPQQVAWREVKPLWECFADETFGHYDEHTPDVRAWREHISLKATR